MKMLQHESRMYFLKSVTAPGTSAVFRRYSTWNPSIRTTAWAWCRQNTLISSVVVPAVFNLFPRTLSLYSLIYLTPFISEVLRSFFLVFPFVSRLCQSSRESQLSILSRRFFTAIFFLTTLIFLPLVLWTPFPADVCLCFTPSCSVSTPLHTNSSPPILFVSPHWHLSCWASIDIPDWVLEQRQKYMALQVCIDLSFTAPFLWIVTFIRFLSSLSSNNTPSSECLFFCRIRSLAAFGKNKNGVSK